MTNARGIALSAAREVAEDPDRVGPFVVSEDLGDGVSDFRFVCLMKGYEGWQWSVTLFHDADRDVWTVDESTLVPAEGALLPPAWVPWKDRLLPSDLSVTDALGTPAIDSRLEDGLRLQGASRNAEEPRDEDGSEGAGHPSHDSAQGAAGPVEASADAVAEDLGTSAIDGTDVGDEDQDEAVDRFALTRRRVLSPVGRSQTAERWYQGQHGPRSLSTRTAGKDNPCSTCGFLVPIAGDLGRMFGVCANVWSPDDGRVVSLDHGCGEHSDIGQPAPTPLWMQSAPAYDDTRIDVIRRIPREESSEVELIEGMDADVDSSASDDGPDDSRDRDSPVVPTTGRSSGDGSDVDKTSGADRGEIESSSTPDAGRA
ncbi:DUF3027 domain-containing protein [uncultured Bifidobacterium sp.]|uniref:DUF3027 domain-containing protein n=1 Tax=uncultured Bifidobacterium sp. TaxID=165187 RepID=UPI0028DCC81A|nr:DUF3027 domain-containing protein [uncultured Bifidobacterium sp.]